MKNKKNDDKLVRSCKLSMLIASVCTLLLCTVCLASTTWAWLSVDNRYEGTTIVLSQDCEGTVNKKLPQEATQPEETQIEETQAEETQPEETQPEETQAEETQPEESLPEETQEATIPTGDADEI